jgi:hypothetical protein
MCHGPLPWLPLRIAAASAEAACALPLYVAAMSTNAGPVFASLSA